ncbi:M16 family metallopeptidase [Pararhodobacter zhoushanensis]|uniref:M16 family metallopeptidase n=1 Tax=Pararhodobacter zhoushanensis TaxID=2479545 RepID=UPI000F8E9720|nr:pitrilysin family protein [Pararhodobacter zhoushanensis]
MRILAAFTLALGLSAPFTAGAIDIQDVTSPGGHSAWLVEEHSIPFVSLDVVFTGGAALDPEGRAGAVQLMTSLLTEGAGDLDAQGYASALESLAGSITFEAGRDSVSMNIRALTENRDEVIELAMMALTEAQFGQMSIDRVRGQTVAYLERAALDPNTVAQQTYLQLGYAGHAYATPTEGTPDTVAALTVDDILNAHAAAFTSDRMYVGASGDITAAELGAIVDRITRDLPVSEAPLPEYHRFDAPAGVTVVDFPGPQSVIQFGHGGIAADDDDFMAAYAMNEIFGGSGFGSRLMGELREARGLTYGIYTSLASSKFGDSYAGRFSTGNENAAEAIELVRAQFQWLADGGITQDDLSRIQTYLTGAYPLRFDGNDSIAGILAAMQFQGYPLNYVNIRNDLLRAVTLEDVQRMAQRLAQPDALQFVVVGQPVGVVTTTQ